MLTRHFHRDPATKSAPVSHGQQLRHCLVGKFARGKNQKVGIALRDLGQKVLRLLVRPADQRLLRLEVLAKVLQAVLNRCAPLTRTEHHRAQLETQHTRRENLVQPAPAVAVRVVEEWIAQQRDSNEKHARNARVACQDQKDTESSDQPEQLATARAHRHPASCAAGICPHGIGTQGRLAHQGQHHDTEQLQIRSRRGQPRHTDLVVDRVEHAEKKTGQRDLRQTEPEINAFFPLGDHRAAGGTCQAAMKHISGRISSPSRSLHPKGSVQRAVLDCLKKMVFPDRIGLC